MARTPEHVFYKLVATKQIISNSRNKEAASLWLEVKDLIICCNSYPYKKGNELAQLVIEGYDNEYISKRLGTSRNAIDQQVWLCSNYVFSFLGKDFFNLFLSFSDNKKEIKRRIFNFKYHQESPESLLPFELIKGVGDSSAFSSVDDKEPIYVEKCKKELAFVLKHCNYTIKKEREELDMVKLSYVLDVIRGSKGTPEERTDLLILLKGEEGLRND